MINLKSELLAIVDALNGASCPYAICGGLAVAIHGAPRNTRDIDLLATQSEVDTITTELKKLGYTRESGRILFQTGTIDEHFAFRFTKIEGADLLPVDLIVVAGFLNEVWESRVALEVDGRNVSVVSLNGLAKMKRSSGRQQDIADLAALGIIGDSES